MERNGIKYNIVKTYPNGVRIGNIPSIRIKMKRSGTGMAWFPKNWTVRDMVRAGEHVCQLKINRGVRDGITFYGTYKGVRVGIKKTHGQISTIFPAYNQPKGRR